LRAADVIAILYGIFFTLFAFFFFPFYALVPLHDKDGNPIDSTPFLIMILLYPVFGVIAGWLGTFVGAHTYNLVARRTGGIQVEVAE
jgi:O-antigen/teichoic acid export membrane protein